MSHPFLPHVFLSHLALVYWDIFHRGRVARAYMAKLFSLRRHSFFPSTSYRSIAVQDNAKTDGPTRLNRICVLSAVRIKSIVDLDLLDFSYSVVPDGVYSVLEPCLGVINASLPVLQPVTERLASSRLFSRLKGSLISSSRNQQAQNAGDWSVPLSESSKSGGFQRLDDQRSTDDQVPLTEVVVTPNRVIRKTTDLEVVESVPSDAP